MGSVLPGSARTTPRVRAEFQAAQASTCTLANHYHLSREYQVSSTRMARQAMWRHACSGDRTLAQAMRSALDELEVGPISRSLGHLTFRTVRLRGDFVQRPGSGHALQLVLAARLKLES